MNMYLILVLLIITKIYAPYDPDFYIKGKRVDRMFFTKYDPKTQRFIRIWVKNCVIDTDHVQPERASEETYEN